LITSAPKHSIQPWQLGLGVETGVTLSGISSKAEFGGTITLQYDISKIFALTLTSGYYEFAGNSY